MKELIAAIVAFFCPPTEEIEVDPSKCGKDADVEVSVLSELKAPKFDGRYQPDPMTAGTDQN